MKNKFKKKYEFLSNVVFGISTFILTFSISTYLQNGNIDNLQRAINFTKGYVGIYKELKEKPFIEVDTKEDVDGEDIRQELLKYIKPNVLNYLEDKNLKMLIIDSNGLDIEDFTETLYSKAENYKYSVKGRMKEDNDSEYKDSDDDSYVAGVFFYPEKTIVSYDSFSYMLHEIGHSIDYINNLGFKSNLSETDKFIEIYNKEKDNINFDSYFSSSEKEYFAECFYLFLKEEKNQNNVLSSKAPLTYEYMDTLYNYININQTIDKNLINILENL